MTLEVGVGADRSNVRELIGVATSTVLETMFMTSVECEEDWKPTPEALETGSMVFEITFDGALEGDFRLRIQEGSALMLAATMLCLEPGELGPEQGAQLAGELSNMICGSLLSHLTAGGALRLGAPSRLPSTSDPLEGGINRCFTLPEGAVVIEFRLGACVEAA